MYPVWAAADGCFLRHLPRREKSRDRAVLDLAVCYRCLPVFYDLGGQPLYAKPQQGYCLIHRVCYMDYVADFLPNAIAD
ncbi:hypothetical protein D3C81_1241390 [compost metagenome]